MSTITKLRLRNMNTNNKNDDETIYNLQFTIFFHIKQNLLLALYEMIRFIFDSTKQKQEKGCLKLYIYISTYSYIFYSI